MCIRDRVAAEQLQYFIFQRREPDAFPIYRHNLALDIQHQAANRNLLFRYLHRAQLGVPPKLAFYAGNHLGRIERFCDIIVRARREAKYLVRVLTFCGY